MVGSFFWNSKVYDHVCTQPWQNVRHVSLTISVLDKIVSYFLPAQPKGESIYNLLIFKLHFSRQNQVTMWGLSICFAEKKDGSTKDTKLQSILVHLLENNIFMICTYLKKKKISRAIWFSAPNANSKEISLYSVTYTLFPIPHSVICIHGNTLLLPAAKGLGGNYGKKNLSL